MLFALAACGKGDDETDLTTDEVRTVKTKVAALSDEKGLALFKIKIDRSYGYDMTYYDTAAEIVPLLKDGSVDIATLPVDEAAKLYNETDGAIQIIATTSFAPLHVIGRGDKFDDFSSLKGKTVYLCGKGTYEEYYIDYALKENGIDPEKDLTLKYLDSTDKVTAAMKKDKQSVGILSVFDASDLLAAQLKTEEAAEKKTSESTQSDADGETSAQSTTEKTTESTAKNPNSFSQLLDISGKLFKEKDEALISGCIVARSEYIKSNPDIITEFLSFAEISVNYTNTSNGAGAELTDAGLFDDSTIAENAIPGCKFRFFTGEDMKEYISSSIKILFDGDKALVGDKIPDDGIYYIV